MVTRSKTAALEAANAGSILTLYDVDCTGIPSADWKTGGPNYSVTDKDGRAVDITALNPANTSTMGPDGSTGIVIVATKDKVSGGWTGVPGLDMDLSEVCTAAGHTLDEDGTYMWAVEIVAYDPASNYEQWSHGLKNTVSNSYSMSNRIYANSLRNEFTYLTVPSIQNQASFSAEAFKAVMIDGGFHTRHYSHTAFTTDPASMTLRSVYGATSLIGNAGSSTAAHKISTNEYFSLFGGIAGGTTWTITRVYWGYLGVLNP